MSLLKPKRVEKKARTWFSLGSRSAADWIQWRLWLSEKDEIQHEKPCERDEEIQEKTFTVDLEETFDGLVMGWAGPIVHTMVV